MNQLKYSKVSNLGLGFNIRLLQKKAKDMRYKGGFDDSFLQGNPLTYVPVLRFAFTEYSKPLCEFMDSFDIDVKNTNDGDFIDMLYLICKDILRYRPVLTKRQFMVEGMAGTKALMVHDILMRVIQWHRERLTPPSSIKKLPHPAKSHSLKRSPRVLQLSPRSETPQKTSMKVDSKAEPSERSFLSDPPRSTENTCPHRSGVEERSASEPNNNQLYSEKSTEICEVDQVNESPRPLISCLKKSSEVTKEDLNERSPDPSEQGGGLTDILVLSMQVKQLEMQMQSAEKTAKKQMQRLNTIQDSVNEKIGKLEQMLEEKNKYILTLESQNEEMRERILKLKQLQTCGDETDQWINHLSQNTTSYEGRKAMLPTESAMGDHQLQVPEKTTNYSQEESKALKSRNDSQSNIEPVKLNSTQKTVIIPKLNSIPRLPSSISNRPSANISANISEKIAKFATLSEQTLNRS